MPHAIEDEAMGGVDEDAAVAKYLRDHEEGFEAADLQFDQTDKADDAVDYEDFSDDDLPEEQEPEGKIEETTEEDGFLLRQLGDFNAQSDQPATNGVHDFSEHDLFGETDENNDLFGEHQSSPEVERHAPLSAAIQQQPSGLALPSKSALALPTYQPARKLSQPSSSSISPPPFPDRGYAALSPTSMTSEDDDHDLDPQLALQRSLFKASKLRTAGDDEEDSSREPDWHAFYSLYPEYEKSQAPRFVELFPPRFVEFKGKAPLKPPRVMVPTKLSLDLLHDQERAFKALAAGNKSKQDSTFNNSLVPLANRYAADSESDDDLTFSELDETERVGNLAMHDLALICQDWDIPSVHSDAESQADLGLDPTPGDWDMDEEARPHKKRRVNGVHAFRPTALRDLHFSFEDPERTTAKLAKSVALDLNDPHLLIDEHAPQTKRKLQRVPGDSKRDSAVNRDLAKRYNISNDQAYDLLKENHQHKVRSTLGSMVVEHSYPAAKLQFPFYKVNLDPKAKRAFHRPHLELKQQPGTREYRFTKPKHIKRKHVRGREAKEVFAKAEDLSLGDSASMLLLEYAEEAPMMLSNFGMGNRLINYYRKQHADDQERGEKKEIGEAQILLTQDKSPFSNFGHVDKGETVPTLQNGLYRAPVFSHAPKQTDFVIGISSTYEGGDRFFLRNVENLHAVGQQFPLAEVPGQHSRRVTDAAKKRLRALSYRIYTKSLTRKDKVLDNASLMPHLPGHDMPQTRSKMREFMKYERVTTRGDGSTGVWVPQPGHPVPDAETLRGWIRPEDVCLLDSMQVGVQHLMDLGISEGDKGEEDKDIDEGANIELQLAPWRASKNFLNACQGKAMLKLHGDGDPTGQGLAFSFVKTSMKGGFQAQGESVEDKIDKQKRKDTGGHSYNVAKQQKQYEESIRRIWESQRASLQKPEEISDDDMEDEPDRSAEYNSGRVHTPRSSVGTPAAFSGRHDDDYMSQFSGHSASRGDQTLVITRSQGIDQFGQPLPEVTETITNPAVIREYRKRALQKEYANADMNKIVPTGDSERDAFARRELEKELARVKRNAERREARDRLKARQKDPTAANSPTAAAAAASPGPSDIDGPASAINGMAENNIAQKSKGRSKDGTARKCANCGQVGHIKTNRKSVATFSCPFCFKRNTIGEDGNGTGFHRRKRDGTTGTGAGFAGSKATTSISSSMPMFQL